MCLQATSVRNYAASFGLVVYINAALTAIAAVFAVIESQLAPGYKIVCNPTSPVSLLIECFKLPETTRSDTFHTFVIAQYVILCASLLGDIIIALCVTQPIERLREKRRDAIKQAQEVQAERAAAAPVVEAPVVVVPAAAELEGQPGSVQQERTEPGEEEPEHDPAAFIGLANGNGVRIGGGGCCDFAGILFGWILMVLLALAGMILSGFLAFGEITSSNIVLYNIGVVLRGFAAVLSQLTVSAASGTADQEIKMLERTRLGDDDLLVFKSCTISE